MAQNSRQRSGSSASSKRKYQPERAHVRSSRQVHTATPHVLNDPYTPEDTSRSRRPSSGRSTRSSRSVTRSTRRPSTVRKRSAEKKKHGIGFILLILLLVGAAAVGGYIALYYSNALTITSVEVSGNEKLQSSYVLELADVPEDSTILRTDVDGIKARLLTEPWIQDVSVERVFPSKLVLHVTEQPVAAIVDIVPETATDKTQQWIIAETGVWVYQVNDTSDSGVRIKSEELVEIPKIKDVSAAVRPEAGVQETDEGITNALALLKGFSSEMRDMVATISAPDAVKTTLTLYNNVGVAFGAAEDIEAKEQAIASLLAQYEGTITYINVRVADRPTYRATE